MSAPEQTRDHAADAAQAPATGTPSGGVVAELERRGLVALQTESDLAGAAATGTLSAYCGFDPSRPSLQIGNLVPVMVLAHLQRAGHRPIIVVGGGTGMIGDPSGKASERTLLSTEEVAANVERLRGQLARFLSFEGANAALLVNNADWLDGLSLIGYLRDIAKHFTVNWMLAKESVRARLEDREQGISLTEFVYMTVQATDFLHLYDAHGCTLQLGGQDQWGNMLSGVELIRRARGVQVHALAAPLITNSAGQKLGKTEKGAIFLDPQMTSPYEMFQYLVNTEDAMVGQYLRVFTFLPLDEIAEIERRQAEDPGSRPGQRTLAYEVTRMVHGREAADGVRAAANALFYGGLNELRPENLEHLATAVPTTRIPRARLNEGITVLDALVETGAQPSRSAAKRLVQQGGLYVNDVRWSDAERPILADEALFGVAILLRAGKNKYHLLLAE